MDMPIQNQIVPSVVQALKKRNQWHFGNEPHADWVCILIFFCILMVLGVFVGISTYGRIGSYLAQPTQPSVMKAAASIDVSGLQVVLDEFEKRSTESATLMRGYIGVGDPSL